MTLAAGTKVGPYEIRAPLGAGGMGEVYRAKDPRLGRDVAIKVLPASLSQNPDRLKRFEQEARAAGVLNHPNITIVYDVGQRDGAPYVVQELLEGETLRQELAGGRFLPRRAIDYAIQIALGLAAAHEKGIVHRDLKPENLFVTNEGRVKILDFGLAKLTQVEGSEKASDLPTATEPGVVMGTLGYMSPEQVKSEPPDARSDIFALGVILYEMLAGQRPFKGESAGETMVSILREEPPDLSVTNQNVSPGLERLVRHCLEKKPERRFQSARDLAYDLESLSFVSGAAPAPESRGPAWRTWRKPLAAAALIALALVAGWASSLLRPQAVAPSYKRLTFRRGTVNSARFTPEGQTVVYSAAWEGQPARIFAARAGRLESRELALPEGRILAVSSTGDLAISISRNADWAPPGTLARVPLEGGAPRELLESVTLADWTPDGRDLAVVHSIGGKDRLEFPIGKVLYESAATIASVRFSPRGDRLAVGIQDGTLLVVDLSGKTTVLVKDWRSVGNVAWRADGSEIWFSAQRQAGKFALYAVTPSGRVRLVRREAAGLYLLDLSKDGRALLNEYFWYSSLIGLPAGESAERELSWMDQPYVNAISRDGQTVLFDEWGEGRGEQEGIYIRAMDGSAAVQLGEGHGLALSPDGRWVLSWPSKPPETFLLLPTGPGQARSLKHPGLSPTHFGRFFPDGKRILFLGLAGSGSWRFYVQDLEGGTPRAVSPEGVIPNQSISAAMSPDGRFAAAPGSDAKIAIFPLDGGAPRPLAGSEPGDYPIVWSADGGSLYTYKPSELPARVFRIDNATGRRELWKTLVPADRSGLLTIDSIAMTPDARSYVYCYQRILTSLELAEGLR